MTTSVLPPSSQDPVVAGLSQAIGGPPGRRARLGELRLFTPVRVVVALTLLTSLLGLWQKSPCRVHPWADSYQYTRACYTDVFALYFAERLNEEKDAQGNVVREGARPYLDHPVEYPPVIGAVMAGVAKVVTAVPDDQRPRRFYDLTWVLLTACAVLVAVTTARLAGRRRVWDAALVAVAPVLLLHATTNWDLVAMALAGLGLLQWARSRPLSAGVLLGLATVTKLYPVLFLVPLVLLGWRARRLRAVAVAAVALVVTALSVALPVYLTSPYFVETSAGQVRYADSVLDRLGDEGLSALAPTLVTDIPQSDTDPRPREAVNAAYRFVHLNSTRPADWDSLYYALQTCRDKTADNVTGVVDRLQDALCDGAASVVLSRSTLPGEPPVRLNTAVAVSFVLSLLLIAVVVLKAPRRARLAQVLFLVVVAFLLTNKVYSPQFSLWLVPLAVLARPRWGPFLAWQAAEVVVLFSRFYFFVGNDAAGQGRQAGIPVEWFLYSVLVRDALLLWLCALVVRDLWRPERDVVRADGTDDPMGGVLDGAPDRRAVSA